jgi:tetratricopeptide (TPR) repeat protein
VAVIVIATAILIPRLPERTAIERLARDTSLSGRRTILPRLAGFAYAPVDTDVDTGARLRAARAADEVFKEVAFRSGPADLHAAGIALLLLGKPKQAAARLEEAAARQPRNAAIWNDLAAARYAAGRAAGESALLADALGASHRALIEQPALREAQFNQALILEALGLEQAAIATYQKCAKGDGSPWAAEALQRVSRLRQPTRADRWKREQPLLQRAALTGLDRELQRFVVTYPQEARTWYETVELREAGVAFAKGDQRTFADRLRAAMAVGKALAAFNGDTLVADAASAFRSADGACAQRLAAAHSLYYNARLLYRARESARALPMFRDAERDFGACNSPMSAVAGYYVAQAVFDAGQTTKSERMVDALSAATPPTHHSLRAQLLWLRATIDTRRGLLHEALAADREAMFLFQRLGEEANFCAMSTAAASLRAVLGSRAEAWRMRAETFRRISRSGDSLQMQTALDTAARTESLDDQWTVALPLLAASLDLRFQQNPRIYANALIWYALAEQTLGIDTAPQMIERAVRAANSLKDPDHRKRALADVMLVQGIVTRPRDPRAALLRLNDMIGFAKTHGYPLFLPEAHLERGLAYRAIGDDGAAEADLREALRLLDDRATNAVEQRLSYFRTADLALEELVDMLQRRGDIAGAFAAVDGARGKPFGGSNAATISAGTLVVEYVALRNRLLIFTRDTASVQAKIAPVDRQTLRKGVEALDRSALSAWLVTPIADKLVRSRSVMIVADRSVANVPFAALRTADGHYLVEYAAISLVPSASLVTRDAPIDASSIVAVGDPAFDQQLFDLPRLPAAAIEARRVAALYPKSVVLTGREATRENVEAALRRAPVLQLATHAVAVLNEPAQSYLALTPSAGNSGALSLQEISGGSLSSTSVVVLTGCRTAVATHGAPVSSLALAFLAAGATNVIGSLWDVPDDEASIELTTRLHRALRSGSSPAAALREAQLAFIHSTDPRRRHPRAWSGFQLYASVKREGGKNK